MMNERTLHDLIKASALSISNFFSLFVMPSKSLNAIEVVLCVGKYGIGKRLSHLHFNHVVAVTHAMLYWLKKYKAVDRGWRKRVGDAWKKRGTSIATSGRRSERALLQIRELAESEDSVPPSTALVFGVTALAPASLLLRSLFCTFFFY